MPSNWTEISGIPYEVHFDKCFGPMNTRQIDGGVGEAYYVCQLASMISISIALIALAVSTYIY